MYAIVDIETTGGKFNQEGITEIAIYKYNGREVTDQFISLVNPERPIQPFVVGLTGINNDMLRNAPKFYELAKRIIEITNNCVLIAHNAKFDYRILRLEYQRLGYEYKRQSLCTVELSKKLLPGMPSYSLGKLVKNLGIPITDRHRASGDALATVKLFKLLLQKDSEKEIIAASVKNKPKTQLDAKLIRILEELPPITGVYYMHNDNGEVIYVGKSKNIKKRLTQHFTNTNPKSKKIQQEISTVTYEATGVEVLALLKENEEIKKIKPTYNRALRKDIFNYALYHEKNEAGYLQLKIAEANAQKQPVTTFTNVTQAKNWLNKMVEEFDLCLKLCGLHQTSSTCFNYGIKKCNGACIQEEPPAHYNKRVQALIDKYSFKDKNMLIIDRGRDYDEKSVLLIENGHFKGMGYFNLNHQIASIDLVKNIITPMKSNRDSQHIIQNYLRKNKPLRIVKF